MLLWKNPLSPNNIISDLEPSPDSIHYLNPLVSILQGKGLVLSYQGRSIPTNVPPLYSLILFPIYAVFHEVRFFYIINVLLTIVSAVLFYKIISKLFASKIIKGILYFSFVTNYVIYWYPSVAMAENLLIPLYLFSIWLLLQPVTIVTALLFGFLITAFFATKYIAWILSLTLTVVFMIKIISSKTMIRRKYLLSTLFFLVLFVSLSIFAYTEYFNKGINIIDKIIGSLKQFTVVFSSLFTKSSFENLDQLANMNKETYSKFYLIDNSIRYLAGIMGGPIAVAGENFIILPVVVGMTSIFAVFINLLNKKNRLINFYFLLSTAGTVYFISTFYIVDARYLFEFIPVFLLIFGIFLSSLCVFLNSLNRRMYGNLILFFVCVAIIANVFSPIIKQIKINFYLPETALNYEAINVMNVYTAKFTLKSKPVIISVLSPYQIDFFSNHKYDLLPLSGRQYFIDVAENVWGINLKNNLEDIYQDYIVSNRSVYISDYKTNNNFWFFLDMKKIKERFNLIPVARGCNDECNLYRLELK